MALFIKGRHIQTLHYHLGQVTQHTVHEAELVGLLLGLHMLNTRKGRGVVAMIGIDNQAAIKALTSDLRSPGHHLVWEALRIANSIEKKKKKKNKAIIIVWWMAGHKGLVGNKLADREAKEAAKGHMSDTKQLPLYLRKPLLMNITAIKAAHNKELKNEWRQDWRSSERGKVATKIDDTTPSSKFVKLLSNPKITRLAASRIAQLRLSHVPLNAYLKRIRRVDSARCAACGANKENTKHFLLRCLSYAHKR